MVRAQVGPPTIKSLFLLLGAFFIGINQLHSPKKRIQVLERFTLKYTKYRPVLARIWHAFLVEIHSRLCLSLQVYRDSDEITPLNFY